MNDTVTPTLVGWIQHRSPPSSISKGINSHVTKSVVPMALALHKCTPNYNAVGMADFVTPTLVGGKA